MTLANPTKTSYQCLQLLYSFAADAVFSFIWAVGTLLYRSVLLTQINTNIVARSDLYCLFLNFTCPETSFMYGEQEVLIPSMLLYSLCDSLNSSRFVVVRTSNMAASIHWPASCSRVSKSRSGYPLV